MSSLIGAAAERAFERRVPLSVQVDLTWRCNERCIHCYLDHDDRGEMTTAEITALLDQLAGAGVFFLTFSGGEIFLRRDLFEILEYARRRLHFDVTLKTNALLIGEAEARRIRELGVRRVQVSVYSHRASVHDAITKVRGSFERTVAGIQRLRALDLQVVLACPVMKANFGDYPGVQALAAELGARFTIDPTITPHLDGDRSALDLNVSRPELRAVFQDASLTGGDPALTAEPGAVGEEDLNAAPCSAGHTACYVSPYGDVYPCVQFPLPSGNVRRTRFADIWHGSRELEEVRSIRVRDLTSCSACVHGGSCSRCPGLAYMEGSMRGPSTADCEKSLARTGIASATLVQIAAVR